MPALAPVGLLVFLVLSFLLPCPVHAASEPFSDNAETPQQLDGKQLREKLERLGQVAWTLEAERVRRVAVNPLDPAIELLREHRERIVEEIQNTIRKQPPDTPIGRFLRVGTTP
jgi:hypothetical protein